MTHPPLPLTYRAVWTDDVNGFLATCDEVPLVTTRHEDARAALRIIRELVEEIADEMRQRGALPPELLTRKKPNRELALRGEHPEPSAESLAEMPEMDFSRARRRPEIAARIAREGMEIIVERAGAHDDTP